MLDHGPVRTCPEGGLPCFAGLLEPELHKVTESSGQQQKNPKITDPSFCFCFTILVFDHC